MPDDNAAEPREVAIEQLEQFGLSTYAARTFVALVGLGAGTARDVSEVSDVPRTRVYDAVGELRDRGLVDVRESSPRQFWPISADTASRTFERDLQHRADRLRTALDGVEPAERGGEQRGVWTVEGRVPVTERVLEFFDRADEELVYMTVEELLTDELVAGLAEAAERGVDVKLGGVSPAVQERIREDVPGATMFESLWMWSDTPAARLMLVDRRKTLVSALVGDPDDPASETAIWGQGTTNSLVVVLKAIFAWRLDSPTDD